MVGWNPEGAMTVAVRGRDERMTNRVGKVECSMKTVGLCKG